MSEEEKLLTEARDRAELRTLNSDIARLNGSLMAYARLMEDVAAMIRAFVATPTRRDEGAPLPDWENLRNHMRSCTPASRLEHVEELAHKAERAAELKRQVDSYGE